MNNECLAGYKISMTSSLALALFNTKEPLYGQLTNAQVINDIFMHKQLLNPLVELE